MKRALVAAIGARFAFRDARPTRALSAIADRLDTAIYAACGLEPPTPTEDALIREADHLAAWMEARDCCHPNTLTLYVYRRGGQPAGMGPRIKPWPWPEAEARFLELAARYLPTCPE